MAVLREDVVQISFEVDGDPFAEVNSALDSVVSEASKAVQETETEVSKLGKTVADETVSAANEADSAFGSFFSDFAAGFKSGFAEVMNGASVMGLLKQKALQVGTAIVSKALSAVKSLGEKLKSLPQAALNKIISGMKKLGSAALNASKNVAKLAGKAALGAVVTAGAAAAGGLVMVTKAALEQGAALEQNIGGVETLFGTGGQTIAQYAKSVGKSVQEAAPAYWNLQHAQETVLKNADNAWKTAGLSANDYMETVTGFSAALVSSLGGNTLRAAAAADVAITDMADNANKMGTSMESIQNAYAGFAKGQYTMLDNLKLGYGGTKTEMERLLADAQKVTGVKYDLDNLADVYDAIHVIQGELGITGTTAKEASTTIAGSVSAMKSAWANLLGDMALGKDIDKDLQNLSDSVVTVAHNVLPMIKRVVKQVPKMLTGLINELGPELIPEIGNTVTEIVNSIATMLPVLLPTIINTVINMFGSILGIIAQNIPTIVNLVVSLVPQIVAGIGAMLPMLLSVGMQLLGQMSTGIITMAPTLIPQGISAVLNFLQGAVSMLPSLLSTGIQIISSIGQGIANSLPMIIQQGPQIIHDLVASIVGALPELAQALFEGLLNIIQNLPSLLAGALQGLGGGIMDGIKSWIMGDSAGAEAGQAAATSVSSGIESSTSQVTTASTAMGEAATTGIQTGIETGTPALATAMGTTATTMTTDFSTAITTNTPMMVQSATQSTTEVKNVFDSIDLQQSGLMAGQGFAQGLANSRAAIMAQAQGIANDVKNTINAALQVHSPSRVAMETGQFFGQGLALGLNKVRPMVKTAASGMAGVVRGYADPVRGSSSSTVTNNRNRTTNNTFAPSFVLNMNGASATAGNERKVRRWIKDGINDVFTQMNRQGGYSMG